MMPFFQGRGRSLFSHPVFSQVFHIRVKQSNTEPFPVMAVIQLQIRCILCLACFSVHHFPVKYGHGMIFQGKLRFPG